MARLQQTAELIVGAQFGDEGKGKATCKRADMLTHRSNGGRGCVVVRFSGANNTGATAENLVFKVVPAGVGLANVQNLIGQGVLVMPWSMHSEVQGNVIERVGLREEVERLRRQGVDIGSYNLAIDAGCHLTLPFYCKLEGASEKSATAVGSTGSGVAWSQMMKFGRVGVRVGHCLDQKLLIGVLERQRTFCTTHLAHYDPDTDDPMLLHDKLLEWGAWVRENLNVVRGGAYLEKCWEQGASLLYEGTQGILLDLETGTWPYVTSGYVATPEMSGFVPSNAAVRRFGVMKAYLTRVGRGPFPTQITDPELAGRIITAGHEKGASTGRTRDVGWFDFVLGRYAVAVGRIDELIITKLDILVPDTLGGDTPMAANAYRHGNRFVPSLELFDLLALEHFTPIFMSMPRIGESFCGSRRAEDVPEAAWQYVRLMEEKVGRKVRFLSTGPRLDDLIELPD